MSSPRRRAGAATLDVGRLRELVKDQRVWISMGLVVKRPDQSSHWEKTSTGPSGNEDILVDVDLVGPDPAPVLCRLASSFGGASIGAWRVPGPGTEVVVAIPTGEVAGDCVIIATLATGTPADGIDDNTTLVVNDQKLVVKSLNSDVELTAASGVVKVNGDTYHLPKWDDFLTDLLAYVGAVNSIFNSNCVNGAPLSGYAANAPALATFGNKMLSPPWKSNKAKNG